MTQTLTAAFVAMLLSFPATYFAAALYLIAIDPRSGIAAPFSGAILALKAPFIYVPPAAAVGVLASILNRIAFRTRSISLGVAAAIAGTYVGWRATSGTPAIPTPPAMIAAGRSGRP